MSDQLKDTFQEFLKIKIVSTTLRWSGAANDAYFVEAEGVRKYILKVERDDSHVSEQNDLVVESRVITYLQNQDNTLPIPQIVFSSDAPKAYAYEYVDGETMDKAWDTLSTENKINLCKNVGELHAKLGAIINKDEALQIGIDTNEDPTITPAESEVLQEFMSNKSVSEHVKLLVRQAKEVFDETCDDAIFQFIHNDVHSNNILLSDGKLKGIIDFGDCEYGDVHKDFRFHVRRYPNHLQYIVDEYEKVSQKKLSQKRLISYAILRDLEQISNYYDGREEGPEERAFEDAAFTVKERIVNYPKLLAPYL